MVSLPVLLKRSWPSKDHKAERAMTSVNFQDIGEGVKIAKTYGITHEVYEGFINTFGDKNSLHVDNSYAVSHGFDAKVMQGAILNGFISHFIGMEFPCANTVIQSVDIAFKQPNYLGDELNFEAVVDQKSDAVRTIVLKITITNVSRQQVAAKAKVQIGLLKE